jgi:hypothetical protein
MNTLESDFDVKIRNRQEGRGNLGCLFAFLLLGALGYLGYKIVPPFMLHYQLKDALDEVAVYEVAGIGASKNGSGAKQKLEDTVISKAREMGIELSSNNINIERTSDKINIHVEYSVPIDLPFRHYEMKFDFTSHN